MAICPIICSFYLARALMHDVACEFVYAVGCAETISANVLKLIIIFLLVGRDTIWRIPRKPVERGGKL